MCSLEEYELGQQGKNCEVDTTLHLAFLLYGVAKVYM